MAQQPADSLAWHFLPRRFWNVALRTAHIVATGALFGGHVFATSPERLRPWLYLTLFTGGVLLLLEAYPTLSWCHESRGLCVLVKLALICSIPWLWPYRVPILVVVLVLASVGSHMPRKLRHYSFWRGRVLEQATSQPTRPVRLG